MLRLMSNAREATGCRTPGRLGALLGVVTIVLAVAACTSGTNRSDEGSASPGSPLATLPSFSGVPTGLPSETTPGAVTAPPSSASGVPSGSGSAGSSTSPAPTTSPIPAEPLRTVTVHSARGDYVIEIWAEVKTATCADYAYGNRVIDFLTAHPCTGLDRVLATTTVAGRPVGFAESSLGFSGKYPEVYRVATRFEALVRRDGTGNLTDLFREGYRLPTGPTSVPSPDAFNVLGQDAGVSVFDVWYLDGPTRHNERPLVHMTRDIFLQF